MGLSRFVPVPFSILWFVDFDFFSLWYLSLNGFVVFRRFFIQWGVSHFRVYRLMGFVTICGLLPIIGSVCRLLDLSQC